MGTGHCGSQLFNNRSHYAREASRIIGNDDGLLTQYETAVAQIF